MCLPPIPITCRSRSLAELGVVGGKSDGEFHPNDAVTREQFAKMLVLAMRIGASTTDGVLIRRCA